jgi:hypothetical protein
MANYEYMNILLHTYMYIYASIFLECTLKMYKQRRTYRVYIAFREWHHDTNQLTVRVRLITFFFLAIGFTMVYRLR